MVSGIQPDGVVMTRGADSTSSGLSQSSYSRVQQLRTPTDHTPLDTVVLSLACVDVTAIVCRQVAGAWPGAGAEHDTPVRAALCTALRGRDRRGRLCSTSLSRVCHFVLVNTIHEPEGDGFTGQAVEGGTDCPR